MAIGELIREARQRAGIQQGYLAACVGCSQSYMSDVEHGRRHCPPWMASVWARQLGEDRLAWVKAALEARYGAELEELGIELVLHEPVRNGR